MKSVKELAEYAKGTYDYSEQILRAYELGLRWRQFPAGVNLDTAYDTATWTCLWRISFISADGEDWQPLYRELRELGWNREKVKREGGVLTYYLSRTDEDLPEGFRSREVMLVITISTCQQVKVGTKEVDVFETRCADWKEPVEYDVLEGPTPEGGVIQKAEYTHTEVLEVPFQDQPEQTDEMQQYGTPGEDH